MADGAQDTAGHAELNEMLRSGRRPHLDAEAMTAPVMNQFLRGAPRSVPQHDDVLLEHGLALKLSDPLAFRLFASRLDPDVRERLDAYLERKRAR